jgi:hypothetical protein
MVQSQMPILTYDAAPMEIIFLALPIASARQTSQWQKVSKQKI